MIERILFPVDFSTSCAAMAAFVRRAADLFTARVTLVHVCDLASHNAFELYLRSPKEIAEEHEGIARRKLASFLASEFPTAKCSRIVCSGGAAGQIAEVARTGGFDLIIMPTHAGRFRQVLLGSTTAKVLANGDCPILTTQHAETVVPKPLEHRVWVCAIGLSADSERVLRLASRAAADVGAKLHLIHVLPGGGPGEEENARRLNELQKASGCEATVRGASGPVKDVVIDAARQLAADVLIIGRAPPSEAFGRPRDLTYSVIRDSPVSVLSV